MRHCLCWAVLIPLGVAASFGVAPGQKPDVIAKVSCTRTSDTTALITFDNQEVGIVELRFRAPTGSFGVWKPAKERFKVDVDGRIMRIHVDELKADAAYRFELRLRTPKDIADSVGVTCPLLPLVLEDGAIDFKKIRGPSQSGYRMALFPFAKATGNRSTLELEWIKNFAKKELTVDLEVYAVNAAGKFIKDKRGDALREKHRAAFSPEKHTWSGPLDGLLDLLRKTQKPEELKKVKFLITVTPAEPDKTDHVEMCAFISHLSGKCLLVQAQEGFDGEALAVLWPVRLKASE
jgi:hypothetical protein